MEETRRQALRAYIQSINSLIFNFLLIHYDLMYKISFMVSEYLKLAYLKEYSVADIVTRFHGRTTAKTKFETKNAIKNARYNRKPT